MERSDLDSRLRQHAAFARLRGTPAFGDLIEHRFPTSDGRTFTLTARVIDVGAASTMMHLAAWADDGFMSPVEPDELSVRYVFDRHHRISSGEEVAARWSTLQREGWRIIERASGHSVSGVSAAVSAIARANGWKLKEEL